MSLHGLGICLLKKLTVCVSGYYDRSLQVLHNVKSDEGKHLFWQGYRVNELGSVKEKKAHNVWFTHCIDQVL